MFALNGSYAYRNALFFFESAMSANNAAAFLAGIQMGLGYKSSLSVVYRNYDKKYHNFYANAVGNHSPNRNERGVYADFHRYVSSRFSYSAGFDWYYYPFMAYRAGKPSYGATAKAQLDFKLTQRQQSNIYFRFLNHQYNSSVHKQPQQLADNAVCQLQLRHKVSLTPSLTAVARAGYSHSFTEQSRKNQGWFAFTEFIYRNAAVPLSFNVRYTFFHTDDYDNRFYVYEYSLPLNYSSAVLQGKGHKLYVLAGYKIKDRAELHLRYTMTRYINNGGSISSGNTMVVGNMLHYIGMQVRYTFA